MVHNKTRVWAHFHLVQQYKVSAELKPSPPSVHHPFWSRSTPWALPLSASKHMAACSFSIWNHHSAAKISQCSSSEACLAMQFPLLNAKRKKGWGKKRLLSVRSTCPTSLWQPCVVWQQHRYIQELSQHHPPQTSSLQTVLEICLALWE